MPVLNTATRQEVAERFMRETSDLGEPLGALLKTDILPAVNAMDDWRQANAASANSAIPQPARAQLTQAQKSRLMTLIFYEAYQADATLLEAP